MIHSQIGLRDLMRAPPVTRAYRAMLCDPIANQTTEGPCLGSRCLPLPRLKRAATQAPTSVACATVVRNCSLTTWRWPDPINERTVAPLMLDSARAAAVAWADALASTDAAGRSTQLDSQYERLVSQTTNGCLLGQSRGCCSFGKQPTGRQRVHQDLVPAAPIERHTCTPALADTAITGAPSLPQSTLRETHQHRWRT